jgi:hypothetical protein
VKYLRLLALPCRDRSVAQSSIFVMYYRPFPHIITSDSEQTIRHTLSEFNFVKLERTVQDINNILKTTGKLWSMTVGTTDIQYETKYNHWQLWPVSAPIYHNLSKQIWIWHRLKIIKVRREIVVGLSYYRQKSQLQTFSSRSRKFWNGTRNVLNL